MKGSAMPPLWGEASLADRLILLIGEGYGVLGIFGVISVVLEGGLTILDRRDVLGISCVFLSTKFCFIFVAVVISAFFISLGTGFFFIGSYF